MKRWYDNVLSGTPLLGVANASVQVNIAGGGAASLFSDDAGTIPLTNPVTTDARGSYTFVVTDGLYDLIFSGPTLTTLTVPSVEISSDLNDPVGAGGTTQVLSILSGGTSLGAVASSDTIVKAITGMTDATYTDVLTISVPNAAHAAILRVAIIGSLGAGGAVGVYEASRAVDGVIPITRTPGLATATTNFFTGAGGECGVAGSATCAMSVQLSGLTGGNTVTQTFTVQVRITHGSGASTNHKAIIRAELTNAVASGITIA